MQSIKLPRITFWRVVFVAIVLAGGYSLIYRLLFGLGASTNLSDAFPWGLWIGFDVLTGVGLAAGGFTVAAVVHIFHLDKYQPIVRSSILTAFLGYVLVGIAITIDIGQPWRIWHPIIFHNPHSVMFEVAWCVILYTTVLALEFSPLVTERLGLRKLTHILHTVMVPIVIAGVILSTLHQSSLGTVYLIVPGKLHALWYSPLLPVFFFISAISVGLAMVIFESGLSSRAFGHHFSMPVLTGIARALVVILAILAVLRIDDLIRRDALHYVFESSTESYLFLLEFVMGILVPIVMLAIQRVRHNPQMLFLAATLAVLGFVLNRLNVSITGMQAYAGVNYFPNWMELSVTGLFVAIAFAAFAWATKNLPVITHEPVHSDVVVGSLRAARPKAKVSPQSTAA
jgi:Ni/Fe-hydrogenase subunit HybB-like protein